MIRKNCKNCGRFFYPTKTQIKNGNGKYCSRSCFAKKVHNGKKYTKEDRPDKFCDVCGEKLSKKTLWEHYNNIKNGLINGSKVYCSSKCSNIDKIKQEKRECKICGHDFICRTHSRRTNCKRCRNKKSNRAGSHIFNSNDYNKIIKNHYSILQRKILGDSYIKTVFKNSSCNLLAKDIPQELIELKRLNIKRKRIIKKRKTHGNSQ